MKRRYIFLIAIFLIGLLGKKSVYAEANEKYMYLIDMIPNIF